MAETSQQRHTTEQLSDTSNRVMSYRERPASPSEASVSTIYDSILSSPPSPVDYGDDRLRNDLLDEICSDMGIHDSMDLDFYDFAYDNQDAFMMPAEATPQVNNNKQTAAQTFPPSCMQATGSTNSIILSQSGSVKTETESTQPAQTQPQQTQPQQTQSNSGQDSKSDPNAGHTVHYKPPPLGETAPAGQRLPVRRLESDLGYQSDIRSSSSRCSSTATNYSTSAYGSSESLNAIFHLTRSITSEGVNFNAYNNAKQNAPPAGQPNDDQTVAKPPGGGEQQPQPSPCFQEGQMRKSVSFSLPAAASAQYPGSECNSAQHSPNATNQGQFTFPPPLSHSNSAPVFNQQGYPQYTSQQPTQPQASCMEPGNAQFYQQGNFHAPMQRSMSQDRQYRNSPSPSQLRQLGHYQKILPRPSQPSRVECGPYAVPSRSPYDRRRADGDNMPYMQSMQGGGEMMSSFDEQYAALDPDMHAASNMHSVQQGLQQNMQNYGRHLPYEPPPPPYPYDSSAPMQGYPQQMPQAMPPQSMDQFQHINTMPGVCDPPNVNPGLPPASNPQMQQRPPAMQAQQPNASFQPPQQNAGFSQQMQQQQVQQGAGFQQQMQQQQQAMQQQQQRRPMFNPAGPAMMGQAAHNASESSPQRIAALSQQNFMQRLVTDKSSAFRSHPLFPLLRDLVIADMNFEEPNFPFQLISNLPRDFNKLLQNYLARNPRRPNYQTNHAVESVITDALKYAHHSLIGKIQRKAVHKMRPMSSVEDFCDKFDQDVRKNMPNPIIKQSKFKIPGGPGQSPWGSQQKLLMQQPGNLSMAESLPADCQNTNMPPGGGMPWGAQGQQVMSNNSNYCQSMRNPENNMAAQLKSEVISPCSQSGAEYTELKSMFQHQNNGFTDRQKQMQCLGRPQKEVDSYANNIPGGAQLVKTVLHNSQSSLTSGTSNGKLIDDSDSASVQSETSSKSSHAGQPGSQPTPPQPKKHASLPKEAVAIMLDWLRAHMDKPYPNDDEKGMLIKQTGLSINQINYWFTNARRRVLPKWRGDDV